MNPFETLGIMPTEDKIAIRRAYVKMAKQCHPDQGGDVVAYQNVKHAYDSLINNLYQVEHQIVKIRLKAKDLLTGCIATVIVKIDDKTSKMIEVKVPTFTYPGTTISFFDDKVSFSRISVQVELNKEEACSVINQHVMIVKTINKNDAERGITLNLTSFDDSIKTITLPPNTSASRITYTFEGEGFFEKDSKIRGNLQIIIRVQK